MKSLRSAGARGALRDPSVFILLSAGFMGTLRHSEMGGRAVNPGGMMFNLDPADVTVAQVPYVLSLAGP